MYQGAALFGDFDTAHPIRQRIGEILLDESFFTDAAGKPLHVERSTLEVWQHRVGHFAVIVDEVVLGDLVPREHHPIRMGDLDVNAAHQCVSRTTSSGLLSMRRPW